ncbi:MAG: dihydrodipicolinate synthase family protein, partial [Pseudomonadota bacterium]
KARRGIYAAALSPLTGEGRLDGPKLAAYCRHLISEAGGCDGVAPLGTTGESSSLSMRDRLAAPEFLADAGLPSDRVILGTGAPSVADAIELTRAALAAGYANVLVLPPYYFKGPSDEGLYAAYAQLIEAVGDDRLRVYLYHFPQMSTIPLSTSLVTRLKSAFGPVIAGLKDSTGDFDVSRAFLEATGGIEKDFDVFPASEVFLWRGIPLGSAGTISGTTNAFGQLARAVLEAPIGAERDAALARADAARRGAAKFNVVAAMRQFEAWRSGDDTWRTPLPPLLPMTDAEAEAFKSALNPRRT